MWRGEASEAACSHDYSSSAEQDQQCIHHVHLQFLASKCGYLCNRGLLTTGTSLSRRKNALRDPWYGTVPQHWFAMHIQWQIPYVNASPNSSGRSPPWPGMHQAEELLTHPPWPAHFPHHHSQEAWLQTTAGMDGSRGHSRSAQLHFRCWGLCRAPSGHSVASPDRANPKGYTGNCRASRVSNGLATKSQL